MGNLIAITLVTVIAFGAAFGAVAIIRARRGPALGGGKSNIDPFTIREPWRQHVSGALAMQRRYARIVRELEPGPLRARLDEIGLKLEHGVRECWAIAQHGHRLDETILGLDGPSLRSRLERASDDTTQRSLQSQVDSLERIRTTRDEANRRLAALQARLGEVVSQAAEMRAGIDHTAELGSAVDEVVIQLTALGMAVDEVNDTGRSSGFELGGPGAPSPGT